MSRALLKLRYVRQARLAEVGEAGQAKLSAAEVRCTLHGTAGAVERLYLERTGVTVLPAEAGAPAPGAPAPVAPAPVAPAPVAPAPVAPAWLDDLAPEAREVAEGAHAALSAIRAILGVS
ncbi:MAG: hypothetical protein JNL38_16640 [Myxococcales bacterium]|nr:hypothetical protein [Myxococcales bacterium]